MGWPCTLGAGRARVPFQARLQLSPVHARSSCSICKHTLPALHARALLASLALATASTGQPQATAHTLSLPGLVGPYSLSMSHPAGPDLPGQLCPDCGVPGKPGQPRRLSVTHQHHGDAGAGQPGSAASRAAGVGGLSHGVCRWARADAVSPEPMQIALRSTPSECSGREGCVLLSEVP